MESKAIEFSRSFTLFCLHESILKYGQDLKNEQWIIEPLANMVIAMAVMDTGYKRYLQIDESEHKDNTLEVLKLSIADQFQECYVNGIDIVNALFTGNILIEKLNLINKWNEKTEFSPKRIEIQKCISKTLYKHKKYYLD
jgi:hypothetical protein